MSKKIIIGRFGKPFGIRGQLYINSFTEPKSNILQLLPWYIKKGNEWITLTPSSTQPRSSKVIAKLPGCDNPESAASFTNHDIYIERNILPNPKSDEYYWTDLEGLTVVGENNKILGVVDYLFATPGNDIMVIKNSDAGINNEMLIPFTKDVIINVDLDKKIINVNWDAN